MPDERTCRVCGCTDQRACVNADRETCHWVADDLCSACAEPTVEQLQCSAGLQGMLDQARAACGPLPELFEEMLADFFVAGWNGRALFETVADEDGLEMPVERKLLLPGEDF